MSDLRRWRGLKDLLVDVAVHGSAAVERVTRGTAQRPFAVLEALPPLAAPARAVHAVFDLSLGLTHAAVRGVARAAGAAVGAALDAAEAGRAAPGSPPVPAEPAAG